MYMHIAVCRPTVYMLVTWRRSTDF